MSMYVVGNPFFFPTIDHLGWELDDHNYSPVGSRGVFFICKLNWYHILVILISRKGGISMSDIYIYILVVLITAGICSLFGVFYVSKVISNQRRLENEIIETTRKAVRKWNY